MGGGEEALQREASGERWHALTDFLCSNRIEVMNVARPRESKEPGVSILSLCELFGIEVCSIFGTMARMNYLHTKRPRTSSNTPLKHACCRNDQR